MEYAQGIPPPRFPLLRFAGVLAPSSSWRTAVVAMRPANGNETAPSPALTQKAKQKKKKKKKKKNAGATGSTDGAAPRDETPPPPSGPRTSLGAGVVRPCYARMRRGHRRPESTRA